MMDPEERLHLIALLAEDRSWDAIVAVGRAILDAVYPKDVFTGESGDSGAVYIAALRDALDALDPIMKNWSKTMRTSVDELELSMRAIHCLEYDGIKTLGDLAQKTEAEML